MNNDERILKETSEIIKEFYHQRHDNGELFNLYSLLGIEHRENETHSVLLADFLSPKGSHGQKDRFLQLFFQTLDIEVSDTELARVYRELYIGKIDEHKTEGGRIDIVIEINDNKWLIENKLYAKDQENQLERYHKKFPDAGIFYLTLDGKQYHQKTEFDVKCISYEKTIINWLEKILEETKEKEYLSNSIKQYYNLIKNITFTGYTQEMENRISEKIRSSKDNLEAAFQIYNNYKTAVKNLMITNLSELENEMKISGFIRLSGNELSDYSCYFYKESWRSKNICLGFEFENDFKNPFVGISLLDNYENIDKDLRENICEIYGKIDTTHNWIAYKYLKSFSNTEDISGILKLYDKVFLKEIYTNFIDYSNELDKLLS